MSHGGDGESSGQSRAVPDLPSATSRFHSCRHESMLARIFLSAMTFSIHDSRAFSSSGTKNDERRDKTVSKFADSDVMWSVHENNDQTALYLSHTSGTHLCRPTLWQQRRQQIHRGPPAGTRPTAGVATGTAPSSRIR